jgi:hypothetical protein
MSGFDRNTIGSFLKTLIPVISLALFMTASAAGAEPHLLLHDAGGSPLVPETVRQTVKRSVEVCLNKNGDLVIQQRNFSLTMAAYAPPDDIIKPQERLRVAQRQDSPSISGISLKLSLQF